MPQDKSLKTETGERLPPITLRSQMRLSEPKTHEYSGPRLPPWASILILASLAFAIAVALVQYRRRAYRTWKKYAAEIGGEFSPLNEVSPRLVTGKIAERPYLLETGTSHEDDAGYYHTRSAVPLKNLGSFVMGIRRKSLLEEVQTRGETIPYDLGQPDFERRFHLFCNDPDHLKSALSDDIRREILRYHDLEIYVRLGEIEWRRAGEQSDLDAIRRLNRLMLKMADTIDSFPVRGRSLTQCLADEKMIERGV